ncbi:MAG TPA: hypothetical protein VGS22_25275 [Thermoanaerobaculia bacterium]|nr:hypothetical protein [Thermoanaerobaculia bacterium]
MKHAEASGHRIDRFVVRTGVTLIAACFAFGALPGWAAGAPTTQAQPPQAVTASWDILDGVATVGLNSSTLGSLGFRVTDLTPTVSGHALHPLSVVPRGAPSFALDGRIGLRAIVAWDGFRGFEGTSMHTRGGFRLIGPAGTFDLSSLELRPGAKGGELELFDAAGMAVLIATDGQWELDAPTGRLRYLNADLRILPDLARLLGDDRYAGVTVGTLDLDATLAAGTLPPVPALPVGVTAPPACGDWTGTVDVSLNNMSGIGQAGISTVNGRSVVVVLPSANLKNVGTANVPWFSKFTNLGVPPWNDQHPFLVWQMTRSTGDFFEPLGRGDLKHAFLTINSGCDAGACTNSHILGLGCSDVYGTSTNDDTDSLAPRSEVTASTGIWAHCGGIPSHFDTNGDCSQDFFGAGESSFTHGLKAAETDLQVPGATYYVEAFYVIRNDANIFNSMGYRQVAPAKPSSTWTFPTVGAYTQGPPINAWVNPTTPGANADNRTLDTGEGHVQLAVKVTDVAGSPGRKRFAYALQNHDFDRRIKSFKIPFDSTGASITNIVYADGDGFAANDWTATTDATGITWTAPAATTPAAEIDYATLVAFRFDIDRTPVPVQATLGVFEAGPTSTLSPQSLAPAGPGATTPGSFFTVAPCRLVDTRGANGPALVPGNVRSFGATGVCGIPSTAKALALNVTAIDALSTGHLVVYSGTLTTTSTLNYTAGINRANNAVVALEADGSFKVVAAQNIGTLQLTVDVSGYFE